MRNSMQNMTYNTTFHFHTADDATFISTGQFICTPLWRLKRARTAAKPCEKELDDKVHAGILELSSRRTDRLFSSLLHGRPLTGTISSNLNQGAGSLTPWIH